MRVRTCSSVTGLSRQPVNPSLIRDSFCSGTQKAVMATTGTFWQGPDFSLIFLSTCNPSIRGICKSKNRRSKRLCRIRSSATLPSCASATSAPILSKWARNSSRLISLSSATKNRSRFPAFKGWIATGNSVNGNGWAMAPKSTRSSVLANLTLAVG